jgi:hypothetical protein
MLNKKIQEEEIPRIENFNVDEDSIIFILSTNATPLEPTTSSLTESSFPIAIGIHRTTSWIRRGAIGSDKQHQSKFLV